jgi:hypothetical protein
MTGRQDDVGRNIRSLLLEEANAMPVDTHRAAEGLRRRLAHTRKRRRVTLAVAASVAAAVVVTVAATGAGGWLGDDKAVGPAQNPDQAETVAREFLAAYGSFDADKAINYLTDDAIARRWGTPEQLHLDFAHYRAQGYQETAMTASKWATRSPGSASFAPSTCTASDPTRSDSVRTPTTTGTSPSVTERSIVLTSKWHT